MEATFVEEADAARNSVRRELARRAAVRADAESRSPALTKAHNGPAEVRVRRLCGFTGNTRCVPSLRSMFSAGPIVNLTNAGASERDTSGTVCIWAAVGDDDTE